MLIKKSKGITPSEKFLANLAEKTFLNLWRYPNVFKVQKVVHSHPSEVESPL